MQYAQIVVKTKTSPGNDIFTYKIPPAILPKIQAGILVSVPFHGRNLEGIVVNLKKSLPKNVGPEKLKSIIEILDPQPVVDINHLELAKWMSEYYLASLGETLFENLVPTAKRQLAEVSSQQFGVKQLPQNDKRYTTRPKPILIHADFETRFRIYLKAIRDLPAGEAGKRRAIIIVPDLTFTKFFTDHLPKNQIAILHSQMTLTERYLIWSDIRAGKYPIILGSASALFAPVDNLGLVIIDQEESSFYKSEQSPRWYLPRVAEKLAQLANARLVMGSLTPNIESFWRAKHNHYDLIQKPIAKTPTQLVNISKERQIISYQLETAIGATLTQKGKVILYVNRKGEGNIFTCPDCGHLFLCTQCSTPLQPQQNKLICQHCTAQVNAPTKCPNCGNVNLKISGITIDRVKHIIENLFPHCKVLAWEKDLADTLQIKEAASSKILSTADIIVGTFYLTKSLLPKADLIGIVSADQSLSLPDFRIQERTFSHLLQIIRLGKTAILQTFIPEHAVMKSLLNNSYDEFYRHEINDRRQMNYPPFSHLMRFIYRDFSEKKCLEESKKLAADLEKQVAQNKISAEIFGPTPAFFRKIRSQYRYHLILKIKSNWCPEISKTYKNWIIDVDPVNMF